MEYFEYIIAIISGLCVCIPLVQKLFVVMKKYYMEKNWPGLIMIVTDYMKQAEMLFDNGSDKKEWVMQMIAASANTVNYEIDMEVVSKMIDSLCSMSKVVNAPDKKQVEK